MALLERVSALIRANLNDLIDRAEDPQKMLKQVTLDMQNQLIQVKTQVAIAIADEHLLRKKHQENVDKHAEWMRKAEIAVDKKEQVENLKTALQKLEQKLSEANAKSELLLAKHRRSRALSRASEARMAVTDAGKLGTFDRMKAKVQGEEAMSHALSEMAGDNIEDKLNALGKDDEV